MKKALLTGSLTMLALLVFMFTQGASAANEEYPVICIKVTTTPLVGMSEVFFGFHSNATLGYDSLYDSPAPPPPFEGIDAYFYNRYGGPTGVEDRLRKSIYPILSDANWTLYIVYYSNKGSTVTLHWNMTAAQLWLGDLKLLVFLAGDELIEEIDMKQQGNYSFNVPRDSYGEKYQFIVKYHCEVDRTPPEIYKVRPKDTIDVATPVIKAFYRDPSGINTSSVRLYLDGDNISEIHVTESFVSYKPSEPLQLGVHTVKIVVEDLHGNRAEKTWKFKVVTKPKVEVLHEAKVADLRLCSVEAYTQVEVNIEHPSPTFPVVNLTVMPGSSFKVGWFNVTVHRHVAELPPVAERKVYLYLEVSHNISVESASLCFRVNSSWLEQNNIPPENIVLLRFNGEKWIPQETTLLRAGDSCYIYEAILTEFSYLAIAGKPEVVDTTPPTLAAQAVVKYLGTGETFKYSAQAGDVITIPVDGSKQPTIAVSANFSDASGISDVDILLNGSSIFREAQVTESTLVYNFQEPRAGFHNITILAIDACNNTALLTMIFNVAKPPAPKDTTPPTLSANFTVTRQPKGEEPISKTWIIEGVESANFTVEKNETLLSMTVKACYGDPSGVSNVELLLDGSDVTSSAEISNSTLSYTLSELQPGKHQLLIKVSDTYGNTRTLQLSISLEKPPEKPSQPQPTLSSSIVMFGVAAIAAIAVVVIAVLAIRR